MFRYGILGYDGTRVGLTLGQRTGSQLMATERCRQRDASTEMPAPRRRRRDAGTEMVAVSWPWKHSNYEDSPLPEEENNAPTDGPSVEELRKAMKAFKKRLKLSKLDAESGLGRGAMTGGNPSGIVSIVPPHQYPKAVWEELVRRGRLTYVGQGLYEITKT